MNPGIYRRFGKRFLDVIASALCLILLFPLLMLLGCIVRWTSDGPALYIQPRVGKNGRFFNFLKFRTMYLEIPEQSRRAAEVLAAEGVLLKIDNDPRVTPFGRWLRKTSLDELPQLVNVLRGEMSLVGPRPLIPFMVSHYPKENHQRNQVKPGLTGYWQIYARSESSAMLQMLSYDLSYINELSFGTDLRVMALTIPALVSGRGAK